MEAHSVTFLLLYLLLLFCNPYLPKFLTFFFWVKNGADSISSTNETVPNSVATETPRESGRALLEALGELEFRKQFLILSYGGGYVCESLGKFH